MTLSEVADFNPHHNPIHLDKDLEDKEDTKKEFDIQVGLHDENFVFEEGKFLGADTEQPEFQF
ncbi:hypothetical protein FRC12_001269, partial [Ceratobasidium sp. 428]